MTDYISRKDVLRYIAEDCRKTRAHLGLYRDNKAVQIDICRIPAADVAPVVHGRWDTTDAFPHHVYCTACNMTYIPNDRWQVWQDKYGEGGLPRAYCPNCGAKMDGGGQDA